MFKHLVIGVFLTYIGIIIAEKVGFKPEEGKFWLIVLLPITTLVLDFLLTKGMKQLEKYDD